MVCLFYLRCVESNVCLRMCKEAIFFCFKLLAHNLYLILFSRKNQTLSELNRLLSEVPRTDLEIRDGKSVSGSFNVRSLLPQEPQIAAEMVGLTLPCLGSREGCGDFDLRSFFLGDSNEKNFIYRYLQMFSDFSFVVPSFG